MLVTLPFVWLAILRAYGVPVWVPPASVKNTEEE